MSNSTSSAKHTPGPWEVHQGEDYICVLRPNDSTDTAIQVDNLEDARVIAAAPELLSLLQALCEGFDVWSSARAAITKAQGGAS